MAYEAAKEGMILLKNEDNLLPLKRVTKIAVIGPNACYNLVTDRQNNVNGTTYGVVAVLRYILGMLLLFCKG